MMTCFDERNYVPVYIKIHVKMHNCQLHNVILTNRIMGQITFNKDKSNQVDSLEVKV